MWKKYRDKIGTKVASKLLNIKHRQLVFTIPFELRNFFRQDRQLLSLLFKSVNLTLNETLKSKARLAYKKKIENLASYAFFILMEEI